jgi:hypothetical protein
MNWYDRTVNRFIEGVLLSNQSCQELNRKFFRVKNPSDTYRLLAGRYRGRIGARRIGANRFQNQKLRGR